MTDERFTVDELAQEIRRVDGSHSQGAGALAEALAPFLCGKLAAYALRIRAEPHPAPASADDGLREKVLEAIRTAYLDGSDDSAPGYATADDYAQRAILALIAPPAQKEDDHDSRAVAIGLASAANHQKNATERLYKEAQALLAQAVEALEAVIPLAETMHSLTVATDARRITMRRIKQARDTLTKIRER